MQKQVFEDSITPIEGQRFGTADLLKEASDRQTAIQLPAAEGNVALFAAPDLENLRARWRDVQGSFVDEPRAAVQKADELVAEVIRRLAEVFATERGRLEKDWGKSGDVSTEDLRQALRHYRSFFDRLLSV